MSERYPSLRELSAAVRARRVSPVELVHQALQQARLMQPQFNTFISFMEEMAIRDAQRIEQAVMRRKTVGPLAGIPISVKDIIFTKGTPTTAGSRVFNDGIADDEDARVVQRLRRAGTVIFGKTNLHEIALGVTSVNEHYGAVPNPWDTSRVAGGSSGGSAVAVALGMGAASVGTDTRGSIRIPAACCGISGLKPTYGLVDTRGVLPLAESLDHVGPMARSAEDLVMLLAAMLAPATGAALTRAAKRSVKRLRIGISSHHIELAEPMIARAISSAVRALRPVVSEVRTVDTSALDGVRGPSGTVAGAEAYANHQELLREFPEGYGPIVRQRLSGGAALTAAEYIHAREVQDAARRTFAEIFKEVDVLVGAVLPVPPPTIGSQKTDMAAVTATVSAFTRFNAAQNMAGVPALSVPCGMVAGLPVGLQIIGPQRADALVLSLGVAFQRETDWHEKRPPIPQRN